MIDKLIVEAPLNSLSLGQVSLNILKSLHKRGIKVYYCPIGQPDLSAHKISEEFKLWLQTAQNSFLRGFNRKLLTYKIWHLNGSHMFPSDRRVLLTFHECDSGTQEEVNIIKNTDKTFFCGQYSKEVFGDYGLENIDWFPLGYDKDAVFPTSRKFNEDGRINWLLGGKCEFRKATYRLLNLWVKKYGLEPGQPWINDKKHFLHVAIANPFYNNPQLQQLHAQEMNKALNGKRYYNVQFYDWFQTNSQLNELYNQIDIDITGMSMAESWNLVSFNVSCLGAWSIVLNATGHKSWATNENSILVSPTSKVKGVDNIFFHENAAFSVGNFWNFTDEDFYDATTRAEKKVGQVNEQGKKLCEIFTYDKMTDDILFKIEKM